MLFLGVMGTGREADRSRPSGAEVKNGGEIPPLPHTCSKHSAYCLTNQALRLFYPFYNLGRGIFSYIT